MQEKPNAKIAVQYLNDDLGKDFLRGLRKGLGDKGAAMIVKEVSHELSEPSIESQVADCIGAGADVFVQLTTSKFAAQGIRKVAALNWHSLHIASFPRTAFRLLPRDTPRLLFMDPSLEKRCIAWPPGDCGQKHLNHIVAHWDRV
jgi:hypothetical protein